MPAGKTLVQLLALSGLRATMQASQTDRQTDEWTDGRTDRWRDYTNSPSYCVVCIAENCQKVPFNHAVFGTGVITVSSSSWLVMLFVFYMPTMHPARIYQLWIGKYHNYEHYRTHHRWWSRILLALSDCCLWKLPWSRKQITKYHDFVRGNWKRGSGTIGDGPPPP